MVVRGEKADHPSLLSAVGQFKNQFSIALAGRSTRPVIFTVRRLHSGQSQVRPPVCKRKFKGACHFVEGLVSVERNVFPGKPTLRLQVAEPVLAGAFGLESSFRVHESSAPREIVDGSFEVEPGNVRIEADLAFRLQRTLRHLDL